MNNDPLLSVEYLSKSFRTGHSTVELLHDINLNLFPSCSMSVQGISGCGKTTLLNLIAAIEIPYKGEVRWQGRSVRLMTDTDLHRERARFIGFIFQHYSLIPELSVLDNVLLPGRIVGNIDTDRALELIERVGLTSFVKSSPQTLSGGERQRLAIARALYNKPKLILADEPTGNLDEVNGRAVVDLLWDVARENEAAVVLITHNPIYAHRADYRYRLSEGNLYKE